MKYFVILLLLIIFFMFPDDAFAVCCFPYDVIHYIDPITGSLVVSGELWNDSYKVEPFGNAKYEFVFYNSTGDALFERELLVTVGHPIHNGFVVNPLGAHPLPFQMVIEDIDFKTLNQVAHVGTGGTHVDYFSWKPTDLNVTLTEFKKIETIQGQTHGTLFDKWQVSGTITNTHYEATQNVYVLASLYESEHRLVGVAGYSNDDIQPKTLKGHETKEFRIHALIPQEKSVEQIRLYAESDNSSMKYPNTKPIILKPDVPTKHGTKGNSIPISVNVTNISRENIDFDWILQIKKSPKSLDEGDITNYPESKVAFIDVVHADVMAQESKQLEYLWTPITGGIYFYEMYMWDNGIPVSLGFAGSFLYSDQILVTSNSLKEQLASGISFENLQCMDSLDLIQKYDGSPACVKPETKSKLLERGWGEHAPIPEPEFKDEKITIIKISKGEIVSENAMKFNGWTNQPNQKIVLSVTAPNGNIISTGKLSPMDNGTFVDAITTGGPLWKQQDGIYLVTVQQGNDPKNSAYFELELKDGNIITGK